MRDKVRVRFAPSPTGYPHLGNMRTALFNWCLARANAGHFILRIEDTDRERLVPGAVEEMKRSLRWLGLDWDEGPDVGGPYGPYVQSERLELYREAAERLVAEGKAYRCACSRERLEKLRAAQRAKGVEPRYDGHCRELNIGPDIPHVIRFKMPLEGRTEINDRLRGRIIFENRTLDDFVLLKSDGFPTYHLANVVDDHYMAVTHVMRGDEWLPSTPRHVQLYRAFGWEPPVWIHLPLITDKQGRKLKKRDPSQQMSRYIERGYLPEGIFNYLALLGWHPGTTDEVMMPDEIVSRFSLDKLSKGPAAFDPDRLDWFNRQHMTRLSRDELVERSRPWLERAFRTLPSDREWLGLLIEAIRDEMRILSDAPDLARFAFEDPAGFDSEAHEALHDVAAKPVLEAFILALPSGDITREEAEALFAELRHRFKSERGWGGRRVMFPIRAALTGSVRGPHLAEILALIGPEVARRRARKALDLA